MTALSTVAMPTLLLWPNIDAGSEHINKAIRVFRTHHSTTWLRTMTNLGPEDYLNVLATTACAVGNSSSFVRDAGFFGTPVVLVGNRQNGRETDRHVVRTPVNTEQIVQSIRSQLANGRYKPSTLYGDGNVSPRIAECLKNCVPIARSIWRSWKLMAQSCWAAPISAAPINTSPN